MGYQTDFYGSFKFSRQLTLDEKTELNDIHEKDWRDTPDRPDEYSYYCQWESSRDGKELRWDGGEKFYGYIEWLKWLIEKFFAPRGILLNGQVEWEGEENDDMGQMIVKDNVLTIKRAKVTFEE